MRLWYLSHGRPAKAQASLRNRAVSPEPSLFAHMNMKYSSRGRVRPNNRHLAPLDGCACAFEEWVYGGWKEVSLKLAQYYKHLVFLYLFFCNILFLSPISLFCCNILFLSPSSNLLIFILEFRYFGDFWPWCVMVCPTFKPNVDTNFIYIWF